MICAFDIETTRLEDVEQSIMYVWQFQIGDDTIIGRTWDEFLTLLQELKEELSGDYLLCFVHNLSYEFQFLRGVYPFTEEEVFIIRDRKILKCEMYEAVEFRCSYLQTNMSLDEFTHRMGVKHAKTSMDYNVKRYPWTPIDDIKEYIVNDVAGLVEAMRVRIYGQGDNLYTVPLTSTGYVRREAKRAMRHYNRGRLLKQLPDPELYMMLREAFRGGNTHANRYYAGQIIKDVLSYDRSSSYPDCQCNDKYPMGIWYKESSPDINYLLDNLMGRRAALFRICLVNVRLKDRSWGFPYLARDKCRKIANGTWDNGRILSCDYCETTMTDVDLRILVAEYKFDDAWLLDLCHTRYGTLPEPLTNLTKEYYKKKTELKGVVGAELAYMRAKELLNSVYSMGCLCKIHASKVLNILMGSMWRDRTRWKSLS